MTNPKTRTEIRKQIEAKYDAQEIKLRETILNKDAMDFRYFTYKRLIMSTAEKIRISKSNSPGAKGLKIEKRTETILKEINTFKMLRDYLK